MSLAPFVCLVHSEELRQRLREFFDQFELPSTFVDSHDVLASHLESLSKENPIDCCLVESGAALEDTIGLIQVMRFLPQTKETPVIVFTPSQASIFPLYQVGATLCLATAISQEALESAFDTLFGDMEGSQAVE